LSERFGVIGRALRHGSRLRTQHGSITRNPATVLSMDLLIALEPRFRRISRTQISSFLPYMAERKETFLELKIDD